VGFENPIWNEPYFPEECPSDWRLAYFMNDFRAVYLPCSAWYKNVTQIESIADELDEKFELILEWPTLDHVSKIQPTLSMLAPLKEDISCVVINTGNMSASLLDEICRDVSCDYVINLDCKNIGTEQHFALLKKYGAGLVWSPNKSAAPVYAAKYQVVMLPFQSLRDTKSVLDKLKPLLDQGIRAGLFIEPAKESPKRALEVRTLIELLELA
jgi:hypothetical protein